MEPQRANRSLRKVNNIPAHKVHTAIDAYKGTSSHIPNQAIVLDWQVARDIPATRLNPSGSSHVRVD